MGLGCGSVGKKLKPVAARCQAVAAGRVTGACFLAIRHKHRELHNLRPVMLIKRGSHCSKTVTQPLVELLHIAGFGVEVALDCRVNGNLGARGMS